MVTQDDHGEMEYLGTVTLTAHLLWCVECGLLVMLLYGAAKYSDLEHDILPRYIRVRQGNRTAKHSGNTHNLLCLAFANLALAEDAATQSRDEGWYNLLDEIGAFEEGED